MEQKGQVCVYEKVSEGVGNVGGKGVTVSTVFLSDYRGDYAKKDTE